MHRPVAMRPRDDRSPPDAHLDPPPLERAVEPAPAWHRRRRSQLLIVAASLAVIAASAAAVSWRLVVASAPAPLPPPTVSRDPGPAAAPAVETPTAALAADDPIGPAVAGDIEDDPDGWRGLAASPDQFGVVAAWSERELWVSRDDGRTFHQELAAPEALAGAAVGDDGRVYAARHGGRFGMLTPGGRTRWLRLDYDQALAVATGGRWTALLTLAADRAAGLAPVLWLTRDDGASWRRLVVPAAGDLENRLRVAADGTIDLLVRSTGELAPRIRHLRGHVDGRPFAALLDAEDPQPFGLGHDGATLGLVWGRRGVRLEPVGIPVADWNVVVGSGPRTLVVADRRLLALDGTGSRPLSGRVPGPVRGLTSDGIGRSLAVAGRALLRHSPPHGWRDLFDLPAPTSR